MSIFLAFIAAILLGIYQVSKKLAVTNNEIIPVAFFSTLTAMLSSFIIASYFIFVDSNFADEFQLTAREHFLILIKSIIISTSWILSYAVLKNLPISYASTIRESGPIWTVCGALFFFNEQLTLIQLSGIILIIFAYYMFSLVGKKEGIIFSTNKWIFLMFLVAILGSMSTLYDKYLLQHLNYSVISLQSWFYFYNTIFIGFFLIVYRYQIKTTHWNKYIIATGFLLFLSDIFYFYAVSIEGASISIISVLRRSSILVTFLIGIVVFKETRIYKKLIYLLFLLFGIFLIII